MSDIRGAVVFSGPRTYSAAMTPRMHTNLRLSPDGIEQADALAKEHGLTRSEVLRAAIKVGFRSPADLRSELTRLRDRL